MEKQSFYSNGKLLITGEYLVLTGALALAVPTTSGQELRIEEGQEPGILSWESNYLGERWFRAKFSLPGLKIIQAENKDNARYLQRLLLESDRLNPEKLKGKQALSVQTEMSFSPEWGLGSSSSLINNLASFFGIDPYELFFRTQKGSAYDIACAKANGPVFYRLEDGNPRTEKVGFNPVFKENIAFVYSGQKQDSQKSLSRFMAKNGFYEYEKGHISSISRELAATESIDEFSSLVDEHESIMSKALGMPKVRESHFSDFPGSIKSLGAWGGDFIMAVSDFGFYEIKLYFSKKGLRVIFGFDELVLRPGA